LQLAADQNGRMDALIEEACRRSALLWLDLPGAAQPRPAWHIWRDGAVYVVHGPGEQSLPELAGAAYADVIVRSKDTGGRLLRWRARAVPVAPGSAAWEDAVPELSAKRLNARDLAGQPERWARTCTVVRLEPTGEILEAPGPQGGSLPTSSLAAPPVPTDATTARVLPWVLTGRRGVLPGLLRRATGRGRDAA
jgi:hypothetical protein